MKKVGALIFAFILSAGVVFAESDWIEPGMTTDQVQKIFPFNLNHNVTNSVGQYGSQEEWFFKKRIGVDANWYLYFVNGKLVSVRKVQ